MASLAPTLAKEYDEKHVILPAYVQPKLDGIRLLAGRIKGDLVLLTRSGKDARSSVHDKIKSVLKNTIKENQWFDGEMYDHNARNFSEIVHRFRKDPENLQYHVFDMYDMKHPELTFKQRFKMLKAVVKSKDRAVRIVPTYVAKTIQDIHKKHAAFVKDGYEGSIIRNQEAAYQPGKRTWDLVKFKNFITDEFEIVDATKGTGGHEGAIIWILKTPSGKRFKAVMAAPLERRKEMFDSRSKYIGKLLTVKFQEYSKDKIPRFPVGLAIRDYE